MSLDAAALEGLVKRYLDTVATGTAADVAALYAEDATVEDPVGGGEVHIGRQAIAGFYKNMEGVDAEDRVADVPRPAVTRRHSSSPSPSRGRCASNRSRS